MRETKIENGRILRYPSYGEFVAQALGPSDMDMLDRHSRTNSDRFSGGTWDHAANTAPLGDMPNAKRLQAAILKAASVIRGQASRLDPVYQIDDGLAIDVARYLTGEPEVWLNLIDQNATRLARHANIVYNAAAACVVSPSQYERVSTAIGGAVLGLKSMGIPVSLHVCFANTGARPQREVDIASIDMSSPQGSFDMAQLAAVCQLWYFRRLVFSYWETRDAIFRQVHTVPGGYGCVFPMTQEQADHVAGRTGSILLNLCDMTGLSQEEIQQRILTQVYPKGEILK